MTDQRIRTTGEQHGVAEPEERRSRTRDQDERMQEDDEQPQQHDGQMQQRDESERNESERDADERARGEDERERDEDEQCPECAGSLRTDEQQGETVCEDCGLVVETDEIDRGPEWRAFDSKERDEKSRVGAPTTKMMHDEGLSTNIGWQDKDAYGRQLSSSQREKMQRLRTWNERFRTKDHAERNLKQALGEIERMGSALGLGESVRETASVIYRRALEEELLPGRSIEGVATASLYAAARQAGTPRSIDEVVNVSRIGEMEFERTYRYVVRELGLEIEPADPGQYVPRFASELGISDEAERQARDLLETAKDQLVHVGKNPVGLAAAAVYAAPLLCNEKVTQVEVAEVADVSEVTIRNRYQELLDAAEESQARAYNAPASTDRDDESQSGADARAL